ncbi:M-phase inducer phosphatase-like [Pecten maximus]|uniref:M-phase inducer phosphatase-like n=1 Tax=Pecten maximus TaxID=6579 RepID=UPI00145854BA|nr:M-phase inducer phosphatase-like [Pecten maximus]
MTTILALALKMRTTWLFSEESFLLEKTQRTIPMSFSSTVHPKVLWLAGTCFPGKASCKTNVTTIPPLAVDPLTQKSVSFAMGDHNNACLSADVKMAVDLMAETEDLVADGSRQYCLPTIKGKHQDLKSISPQTMCDVLRGGYDDVIASCRIVDCRYPYEFEGGHIQGAENLYTHDAIKELLQTGSRDNKRHIVIFHCEFSSERGPKMYRFLRAQDRALNKSSYPSLNYPEVYLLDGGYKAFYENDKNHCSPMSYLPMLHKSHTDDLRHFRSRSKSWAAGEKRKRSMRLQF